MSETPDNVRYTFRTIVEDEDDGFAGYVRSRGFYLTREWIPPWTDDETGEEYPGFVAESVCREEVFNGDLHYKEMQFGNVGDCHPERWPAMLDFAQESWIRWLENQGVAQ